jgi:hypothetical protein
VRAARNVLAMALLSQVIRQAAISGQTKDLNAWWGGRQGGRWAEQTVRAAFPAAETGSNAEQSLRELTELHRRGVLTDAELQRLRARLRV